MQFFIDSASPQAIKALMPYAMVQGVTTNPSLIMKSGAPYREVLTEICQLVQGPVSAEVTATTSDAMVREGKILRSIHQQIVVKLPLTWEGLKACKQLTEQNIDVNVTLCFSANQALLAAKAGARFISPFIGRLEDTGEDGLQLIRDIRSIYDRYGFSTHILAASIRNEAHVHHCALAGADVVTLPPDILQKLAEHPLTEKGLQAFLNDWKKTGQVIS